MATAGIWRSISDRAVRLNRRPQRIEWKKFSQDKIEFLKDLADTKSDEESIYNQDDILKFCSQDEEFVKQCLKVSLEDQNRFCIFFDLLEELIVLNNLVIVNDQMESLKFVYNESLLALIDIDKHGIVYEILKQLENRTADNDMYISIKDSLANNSPVLIAACRKNQFDLVKILVSYGLRFRLCTTNLDNMKKDPSSSMIIPSFLTGKDTKHTHRYPLFEGGDEVSNLLLLKLMAKPCYILACYDYACDQSFCINEQPVPWIGFTDDCKCQDMDGSVHYCPRNSNYKPDLNCKDHVECNDPIFKCFELAKLAKGYANENPESREEYDTISDECSQLSVKLLEQCNDINEVQILLTESAGSCKYFRFGKDIVYPRLRVAIEHNHKEFAGHMYCQELLKQKWHGDVYWQGTNVIYKFFYVLLQIILAPIFVIIALWFEVGRSLQLGRSFQVIIEWTDDENSKSKVGWIVEKCHALSHNLDIPLNRFIVFTGYYLLFVVSIVMTIEERIEEDGNPSKTDFRTGYFFLVLYTLSMLWSDFHTMVSLRSIKTYFKFWRAFDLYMHILLLLVLICKAIRTAVYSFNALEDCTGKDFDTMDMKDYDDEDDSLINQWYINCTKLHESDLLNGTDCQSICEKRKNLDDWGGVFLAIAATLSMIRLIYWFQLSETVGPVVINISRVVTTIVSIVFSYALIFIAFTFGIVSVLATGEFATHVAPVNGTDPAKVTFSAFYNSFYSAIDVLFWTILNPGNIDSELNINHHNIRGWVATILVALYQLMIIIVLLNLLIAVMNATVQKVYNQKQLYWKFARTSIWMEYFDSANAIPIPFSILMLPGQIFHLIVSGTKYCRKMYNTGLDIHGPASYSCSEQPKPDVFRNRKKHAKLMLKLIQRYTGQEKFQREQRDANDLISTEPTRQNVITRFQSVHGQNRTISISSA